MKATVRLRCDKCKSPLAKLKKIDPAGPNKTFNIPRCTHCDIPTPTDMTGVLVRSHRDALPMTFKITCAELAEPIARSLEKNGHRVDHFVRVVEPDPVDKSQDPDVRGE